MDKINNFINKFTTEKIDKIIKHGNRYFLVEDRISEFTRSLNEKPFSEGIFLGMSKREFMPSPFLLEIISKVSDKKIVVNEKTEWLFVCGRDIFQGGIINPKNVNSLKNNEEYLIQNEKDENIGIGIFKDGENPFIKNLMDRGVYLRKENQS